MHKIYSRLRGFKSTTSCYGCGDGYLNGNGDIIDYNILCGRIFPMDFILTEVSFGMEPSYTNEYNSGHLDGDGILYANDLWMEEKNI